MCILAHFCDLIPHKKYNQTFEVKSLKNLLCCYFAHTDISA